MVSLTIFTTVYDNQTDKRVDFNNFDHLEESLYHLATLPGMKPKRGKFCKSPSPLISPAVYKSGATRANSNVLEWAGWAALDIDDHDFKGDLKSELLGLYSESRFICYSTASSTEEKPKFRMVFPLSRNVLSGEIRAFWYALNAKFGQMGDAQCKDLSRMYYVPAAYPEAHNFIFSHREADYLDVNKLLLEFPVPVSQATQGAQLTHEFEQELVQRRNNSLTEKDAYDWTGYNDCPFVNKNLISQYKAIAHTDGSGRYAMIFKIMASTAANAVQYKYPITAWELTSLMRELDRDTSNIYAKRSLDKEADRAIVWALRNSAIW